MTAFVTADHTGRFRTFQGVVEIPLSVQADGPLLIKGPAAALPDRPDAAFVRYPASDGLGLVPYLPGSSLKGVLRSGSEALLLALGRPVCNPLETRRRCGEQTGRRGTAGVWSDRCPACLTYGSVQGASVVLIDDGLPWRPAEPATVRAARVAALERQSAVRSNVAIDRQTGAADSGKLFDYEVLVGACFYPALRLRNASPWQAALVAAAIGLLDDGTLRLGSQSSKGLGRVRVTAEAVVIRFIDAGPSARVARLLDAGGFTEPEQDGILTVRRSDDPSATLAAWSAELAAWLPDDRDGRGGERGGRGGERR